jgi:uncharacterized SAM-binding protein YcdF (DUF218 family)
MSMPELFWLKKALTVLVLPPVGPLLLVLFGAALLRRAPRAGRAAVWGGALLLLVLSLPVVSVSLQCLLHDSPALDLSRPTGAQAIVILGGGIRRDAQEYGGDTVSLLSLERVRYGALVARKTGLPILVTGGVVLEGEAEGVVMRRVLEQEFGVPVRWVESRSRNTHENAFFSAPILAQAGVRRILLVGHAVDMRRARAEFVGAGLEVAPAPTDIPNPDFTWRDLIPGMAALQDSHWALYELLANAVRRPGG